MNYEELLNDAYEKVELNLEDSGERFEIPKVQGHHAKNRTILTNYLQIVSHLRRTPEHLAKFLGKELASSTEINGERLILSSKLSSKQINEKIEKYVNTFVLCPKCKKPDTELVEENSRQYLKCLACGERKEVHKI